MFLFLTLLLLYSLLSFGAVLPHSWLAVDLLWMLGIGSLAVWKSLKNKQLDLLLVLVGCANAFLVLFVDPKLAIGMTATGWAYLASKDNERSTLKFLHILLGIGLLEAILGLVQFFVLPGWIFGYEGVNRSSGTLINRNHFAGLLEMLVPVAFGLAYLAMRKYKDVSRSYVYIFLGALIGVSLVFSLSKMGIFSFVITLLFLGLMLGVKSTTARLIPILGFGLFALVFAGALWIGIDVVVQRYAQLLQKDALIEEGRLIVFRDTLKLIGANPSGVGTGLYRDLFRQFQTYRPDLLFDHSHNDYLETAAEWGVLTASLFWASILSVLITSIRAFMSAQSAEKRAILLACVGAIFSILIHSFTDFNLQIPSNAMLFFVFVGIAGANSLSDFRTLPKGIH